jgi:phage/plasmid-like protein (TIGR03299 family)
MEERPVGHEIGENDNVVLHRERAWHGLGIVVEEAPTPIEGLVIAGLDYEIIQRPLITKRFEEVEFDINGMKGKKEVQVQEIIDSHVANYRADTNDFIAVVSSNYQPVQNRIMAEFCEALVEQGVVKCETVGSIRNGAKLWFLLKGDAFQVAKRDEIFPYFLMSNGHDGLTKFRGTPTTVRAVCSNTLHAVIPNSDTGALSASAFCFKHTSNVLDRVEEARKAIKNYSRVQEEFREVLNVLSAKDMKREDVQQFFLENYTRDFGEIPSNPQDGHEQRRYDKAQSALASFSRRFDDELDISGATAWNALNAFTGMVQHDLKARGSDDRNRVEKRVESNLFGLNQERSQAALQHAFKMALV